jgi:hypothetical protein
MTNLGNVVSRVEICAGCHVGAPAGNGLPVRDVNHDMIAAGHPRLNFDYATYVRALPPHWAEKDRDILPPRMRPSSDALSHWVVGRAVTSAASLRLLASRAATNSWPELAEFNCYACHHGLADRRSPTIGAPLGSLTWNEPALLTPLSKLAGNGAMSSNSANVRRLMQESPADGAAIAKEATNAALDWTATAQSWTQNPLSPGRVAREFAGYSPGRWDDACHLYYSLRVIDWVMHPNNSQAADPRLGQLRDALRLPRSGPGGRFNSPIDFDPKELWSRFAESFRSYAR